MESSYDIIGRNAAKGSNKVSDKKNLKAQQKLHNTNIIARINGVICWESLNSNGVITCLRK